MTKNKTIIKALLFTFFLLFIATLIFSQSYEIKAVNKGSGVIGVEVMTTSGTPPSTANYITDITFGLKWDSAYHVDLLSSLTTSFFIKKAGTTGTKSGFNFQSFLADPTPFNLPVSLALNQWVEILSVGNTKTGTDTGTFYIAEKGFDRTTDPNIGVDLVDYTPVIADRATGVLLPITLSSFYAKASGRVIELNWTTESEQNNKGFTIERAATEGENYKMIGWMAGKGNTSKRQEYSFNDAAVASGVKYYYRLRQVDEDGRFSYSEVKTAILDGAGREGIRIAPNPVNGLFSIYFDKPLVSGSVTLKVVDSKGALFISYPQQAEAGKKVEVNVSGLASGQYFLVVQKGKEILFAEPFQKR